MPCPWRVGRTSTVGSIPEEQMLAVSDVQEARVLRHTGVAYGSVGLRDPQQMFAKQRVRNMFIYTSDQE